MTLMNISGCHWSYSTNDFGERIVEVCSLLQGDVRVTFIVHEQSTSILAIRRRLRSESWAGGGGRPGCPTMRFS